MSSFEMLIEGGTILTMDPKRRVFVGDLLIQHGRIEAMGPTGTVPHGTAARTIRAHGSYIIPGFVQSHIHLCQTLMRGLAEDLPLLPWLSKRIWPFEGAHTKKSLSASARLGLSELLLGGVTSALDMGTVANTSAIFEAARDFGFRLTCGKAMMDKGRQRPGTLKETTKESLAASKRLAKKWHGTEDGRLRYAYAPRFILSCTDGLLRQVAKDARELGCLIHTHAAENPDEVEAVKKQTGLGNIDALNALGLLGKDAVLAHCVWLSAKEQKLLARTGTKVAHCPSTNLKLGSGIAKIPELMERGIAVGIGSDGAPCNNRLSMFSDMRLASLLQKPRLGCAAMRAEDTLRLATLGGAEVLGLQDEIGSLEIGKKADVVVISTNRPHLRPRNNPYAAVVHGAEATDVAHVIVDGEWLVRDGELTRVNLRSVLDEADRACTGMVRRSGVKLPQ